MTANTIDIDAIHRLPDDLGANDPAVACDDLGSPLAQRKQKCDDWDEVWPGLCSVGVNG